MTLRTRISDSTVTEYAWDYRNRLTTVTDKTAAGGSTTKRIEYTYDAFDQRTAKRVDVDGNGSWDRYEVFSWADGQEVMRWVDSDGQATTQKLRLADRYLWNDAVDQLLSDEQYVNSTGMPIDSTSGKQSAGNTLWALNDHQGSVRDLIDNNGVIRQHVVYDSFGKRISEVDYDTAGVQIASNNAAAIDTVFGYTGRDWDADIGMQYNRARWYDPSTGRWLSQDPRGFAGGDANLYRYVGNGSTNATDPSGLQPPRGGPGGGPVSPWIWHPVINSGTGEPHIVKLPNPEYRDTNCARSILIQKFPHMKTDPELLAWEASFDDIGGFNNFPHNLPTIELERMEEDFLSWLYGHELKRDPELVTGTAPWLVGSFGRGPSYPRSGAKVTPYKLPPIAPVSTVPRHATDTLGTIRTTGKPPAGRSRKGTQLFLLKWEVDILLECHDDHGFAPPILVSMFSIAQ